MYAAHSPEPEDGHEREHEDHEREGDDEIDAAHDDGIGAPAHVARERPEDQAEHERDVRRDEAERQVDAAAVDDPGEDVAPEVVGAEDVLERRRLEGVGQVELVRVPQEERPDHAQAGDDRHDRRSPSRARRATSAARRGLGRAAVAPRPRGPS